MNNDDLLRLFEQYSDHVYNFARKLTGSQDAADDLLQDVFVQACQYYKGTVTNERAWLLTITYNLHKKTFKKKNIEELQPDLSSQKSTENHTSETEWLILRQQIRDCLKKHKAIFEIIFTLRLDHDLALDEIAQILKLSKTSIFRNMEHIKKIIYNNFRKELGLDF